MTTVTITRNVSFDVLVPVQVQRSVEFDVLVPVEISREIQLAIAPSWAVAPTCGPIPEYNQIFRRVLVNYLVQGGAYVTWELDPHFVDPFPYDFSLQFTPGGIDQADDWTTITPAPQQNVFFLTDPTQRLYGKTDGMTYRIQLTTPLGTYYSSAAPILGLLDEYGWLLVQEVVRKENLRNQLFGSVQGWLLKARRYGTVCPDSIDPLTGEVTDANCPVCFGQGYVGGFYAPVPCSFADVSPERARLHRDMQVGTTKPVSVIGRFLGFPFLEQNDVFVASGSDDRYYIHSVNELATWRSCPITTEVELRRAPYSDIIYSFPISSA